MIRAVKREDIKEITDIYNYYIKETVITFETEEIDTNEMEKRIKKILDMGNPFLVYEENNKVTGYAYADKFRERSAYSRTMEASIYLEVNKKGRGTGRRLYEKLIEDLRKSGIHLLIGVISSPNTVSQKLHESIGFKKSGVLKEAGRKFDKYIDVEFWSYMLNEGRK